MIRFVTQLMLVALFFCGSHFRALGDPVLPSLFQWPIDYHSPMPSASAAPSRDDTGGRYVSAAPFACLTESSEEVPWFTPSTPSSATDGAPAVHFEASLAATPLPRSSDDPFGRSSPSAWKDPLAEVDEALEAATEAPFEPIHEPARLLQPLSLDVTSNDGQAGASSGDVEYQLGSVGGCQVHLSAADLLTCAPKPRLWRGELGFRFGWWGTSTRGVPTKVGEFQDLNPSPFWDFDRMFSDGVQTVNLYGTGLDNEGNQAGLYLFGPRITVGVDYQRYLRRLDHDPLTNMSPVGNVLGNAVPLPETPPPSAWEDGPFPAGLGDEIVSEDLNVGDDYAIRVQSLRTYVKGRLTNNVKYRVNYWMQRRRGARQAIGTQHCANSSNPDGGGSECHVLSQTQQIDWLTTKIEPIVEAQLGGLTVEYSRPVRFFGQTDQVVTRSFGDFGDGHVYNFRGDYPYGVVPRSFTQTDRLKTSVDLPLDSQFYGRLHTGNTDNRNRNTNRRFYGYDLRLTNRYWDRWTLSGFARMNRQSNQFPPFLIDPEAAATSDTASNGLPLVSSIVPQYGLRQPIDYSRNSYGAEANWRPFRWTDLASGLALNFGLERGHISRKFAVYQVQEPAGFVDQDYSPYTSYFAGTSMKWAPTFDTFIRYKGRTTRRPLFGVNMYSGETNTSLPEQQDRIEVGGSWMPFENFIATANIGIEERRHDSAIADFDEHNYPLTFTLWHAPTSRWSFSVGYSHLSNWIDQDIYFPSDTPNIEPLDRRPWKYGGTGQVVNLGGSYAWTPSVSLSGGLELVWARNSIGALEPWPDLPQDFDVVVNRTRLTGGADWVLGDGISAYFRYAYDDYQDLSVDYNSGTAHLILGGFTALY